MTPPPSAPIVGIIMGSVSDRPIMDAAAEVLSELDIPYEVRIVSAHRTPDWMAQYASEAASRGIKVIIAGAGGAAHLPGMTASKTTLPVIGVPVPTEHLHGLDSLLSIVQMPGGVPVATVAIGKAGAVNAALLAARILGLSDPRIRDRMAKRQEAQASAVREADQAAQQS
jgi:5-(carboxyamino)imidazole ribonucleotide mutase